MITKINRRIEHVATLIRLLPFKRKRYQQISKINLVYHIAPLRSNDIWRVNIGLLRPHLHKFDRLVIGVASGSDMVPLESVRKELEGYPVEWIVRPNNTMLGEAATFPELLNTVASRDPTEATFYGHTKGVSKPGDTAVDMWRKTLYHSCLSNVDEVKNILTRYACAGPYKKRGRIDADFSVDQASFHFSGSFFWFRNDQIFSNPAWMKVRQYRYGVEEYLGRMLQAEDAACLYGDYSGNLYEVNEVRKSANCLISIGRMLGHSGQSRFRKVFKVSVAIICCKVATYSHSMVAGGLLEMS